MKYGLYSEGSNTVSVLDDFFFRMAETHGLMERLEKAVTRLESLFSDSHRAGGMECDAINGVNGSKWVFLSTIFVIKKNSSSTRVHLLRGSAIPPLMKSVSRESRILKN